MSNQPDELQDEQAFWDALIGRDEDIDDETAKEVLAVYGIEPKDLINEIIRQLIGELQKSHDANHELGESLLAMSEKYQAMAGERDELKDSLESGAEILAQADRTALTYIDRVSVLEAENIALRQQLSECKK